MVVHAVRGLLASGVVEVMLADDRRSWQLGLDGRWTRTEVAQSREGTIETFAVLKEDAVAAMAMSEATPAQLQAGSMDPRA